MPFPSRVLVFVAWVASVMLVGLSAAAGQVYENAKFGFSLRIPDGFVPGNAPDPTAGMLWVSGDRSARLIAVATKNQSGLTLKEYRKFVVEQTYPEAEISYGPIRKTWFVLSGRMNGLEFYERINFVCGGRYIYGWQMFYPATKNKIYDRVVEDVHRTYRSGRGENGRCNAAGGPTAGQ